MRFEMFCGFLLIDTLGTAWKPDSRSMTSSPCGNFHIDEDLIEATCLMMALRQLNHDATTYDPVLECL